MRRRCYGRYSSSSSNKARPSTGVVHRAHYDSLDDLIRAADESVRKNGGRSCKDVRRYINSGGAKWVGRDFPKWSDAVKGANDLWDEGMRILDEQMNKLRDHQLPSPKRRTRKARWDEHDGDDIDLDRMRNGDAYWRFMRREQTKGRQSIAIFVNVWTRADKTPDQVFWRGSAAISLADLLEQHGYDVEVVALEACDQSYLNGDGHIHSCVLKPAGKPLDVASIVNGLAGWFLRTIWFQSHYVNHDEHSIHHGFGRYMEQNIWSEQVRDLAPPNSDIITVSDFWEQEDAETWLDETLNSLIGGQCEH